MLVVRREGHEEQYRARSIGPQGVYVSFQVQDSTRMNSGEMNLQDRVANQCAVSFQTRSWEGARGKRNDSRGFPMLSFEVQLEVCTEHTQH